jgi:hypothetical protein
VVEVEEDELARAMAVIVATVVESFAGTRFRVGGVVTVESELVELVVCEFDESIEEGGDFDVGGVMVDGCYLWGIPFILIILN